MNNRRKTSQLHAADPHCFWCGTKTVMNDSGSVEMADNTATYDHLYPRGDKRREVKHYGSFGVLSCLLCNWRRNNTFPKAGSVRVAAARQEVSVS